MTPEQERQMFFEMLSQRVIAGLMPHLQQFIGNLPGLNLKQEVKVQWQERGEEEDGNLVEEHEERITVPQLLARIVEELMDLNVEVQTLNENIEAVLKRRRP